MNRRASTTSGERGFALLLVMILAACGVVLGLSYVSVASLSARASENFRALTRARYLAESGLEHALYVLRSDPGALDGATLGPYYVDGSDDAYTISGEAVEGQAGRYLVTASGGAGGAAWTSSMTVQVSEGTRLIRRGVTVGGSITWLPWGVHIHGDVHCNGFLWNNADIDGDVTATGGVFDPWGRINGDVDGDADPVLMPDITHTQYLNYNVGGTACEAVDRVGNDMYSGDPLAGGGAVTDDNVGGVVRLIPSYGSTVRLRSDLDFTGTLLIDGNLRIDGGSVTLTAVDGFPAVIATGQVQLTGDARNVTINGVVVSREGVQPYGSGVWRSSTTINGALVSAWSGYGQPLVGTHHLYYDADRATLHDFSGGADEGAAVTVLQWHD